MDFLTLFIVGKITNKRLRKPACIIAAAVGALLGTVFTLFSDQAGGVATVLVGFIVSCLMTWIAFGRYPRISSLLRDSVIVWGAGALLGGIMTILMSLGTPVFFERDDGFAFPFAMCAVIASVAVRFMKSASAKKSAEVRICESGYVIAVRALCDSGSFLTEPISSLPVIIVAERELGRLGGLLRSDEPSELKLRLVPAHGLGGDRVLRGFIPESVSVDGREVFAVIASDTENVDFSGFGGIVPSALIK